MLSGAHHAKRQVALGPIDLNTMDTSVVDTEPDGLCMWELIIPPERDAALALYAGVYHRVGVLDGKVCIVQAEGKLMTVVGFSKKHDGWVVQVQDKVVMCSNHQNVDDFYPPVWGWRVVRHGYCGEQLDGVELQPMWGVREGGIHDLHVVGEEAGDTVADDEVDAFSLELAETYVPPEPVNKEFAIPPSSKKKARVIAPRHQASSSSSRAAPKTPTRVPPPPPPPPAAKKEVTKPATIKPVTIKPVEKRKRLDKEAASAQVAVGWKVPKNVGENDPKRGGWMNKYTLLAAAVEDGEWEVAKELAESYVANAEWFRHSVQLIAAVLNDNQGDAFKIVAEHMKQQ